MKIIKGFNFRFKIANLDKGKLVRRFTDLVALGCNDTEYSLCTEEEKEEWINTQGRLSRNI